MSNSAHSSARGSARDSALHIEVIWGWFNGDEDDVAWEIFSTIDQAERRFHEIAPRAIWAKLVVIPRRQTDDKDAPAFPLILEPYLEADRIDSRKRTIRDIETLRDDWADALLHQFPSLYHETPTLLPTDCVPGTPAKVEVMRQRAALGQSPFHENDAADLLGVQRGQDEHRRNGRHSFHDIRSAKKKDEAKDKAKKDEAA